MSEKDEILSILSRPESIRFDANKKNVLAIKDQMENLNKGSLNGVET